MTCDSRLNISST